MQAAFQPFKPHCTPFLCAELLLQRLCGQLQGFVLGAGERVAHIQADGELGRLLLQFGEDFRVGFDHEHRGALRVKLRLVGAYPVQIKFAIGGALFGAFVQPHGRADGGEAGTLAQQLFKIVQPVLKLDNGR